MSDPAGLRDTLVSLPIFGRGENGSLAKAATGMPQIWKRAVYKSRKDRLIFATNHLARQEDLLLENEKVQSSAFTY